ncbi:MAG: TlpA family protein disulfide reductase [Planctomycetes bacterium]|nr:TlpA family protein disulfide reductase [Planctomycetota bacterium]
MRRLALALGLALAPACNEAPVATDAPPAAKPAPSIEVVDLDGLDAALAKHRGRGVLLNFWAIWCAPCVAELPELMEVAREFAGQGGDVVLVSYDLTVPGATLDEARRDVTAFAATRGLDVPILIYQAPDYEEINRRYQLPGGVPVTLALDERGKILAVHDGQATKEEFRELMRTAIGL